MPATQKRRTLPSIDRVLALQIREARSRNRKMSQQQLAEILGVPQSTIARIEKGERAITVSELLQIAVALSVDPSQLLSGSYTNEKKIPVTKKLEVESRKVRRWLRGRLALPGTDERHYWESSSDEEAKAHRNVRGLLNLRTLMDDYEEAAIDENLTGMLETLGALENELGFQRRTVEQSAAQASSTRR